MLCYFYRTLQNQSPCDLSNCPKNAILIFCTDKHTLCLDKCCILVLVLHTEGIAVAFSSTQPKGKANLLNFCFVCVWKLFKTVFKCSSMTGILGFEHYCVSKTFLMTLQSKSYCRFKPSFLNCQHCWTFSFLHLLTPFFR